MLSLCSCQAASLFITNIPVRSAFFLRDREEEKRLSDPTPVIGSRVEVALTLDTHVMGVDAVRKSRQAFAMEQDHGRHFVMPTEGGRVRNNEEIDICRYIMISFNQV